MRRSLSIRGIWLRTSARSGVERGVREDQPPIARVIAVPSEPHFIFDGYFRMRCARPMPMYGVPGLIDHF